MFHSEAHAPGARDAAIDGVRALAMTAVVLMHTSLLPFGWMGVWAFFVVSGYVVTRSFMGHAAREGGSRRAQTWAFLKRRARRLWPVYFVFLALCAGWLIARGNWDGLASGWALLPFLYNWNAVFDPLSLGEPWKGFGHLWTLSVETQFYLIFPLVFFWVSARPVRLKWLLLAIALIPLVRLATGLGARAPGGGDYEVARLVYFATHAHLDAFLIGMAIALAKDVVARSRAVELTLWAAAILTAAGYVAVQVAWNLADGRTGVDALRDVLSGTMGGRGKEVVVYLIPVLGTAAVLVSILKRRLWLAWLSAAPLAWVGRTSYAAYIVHLPVMLVVQEALSTRLFETAPLAERLAGTAVVYALTLLLAWASWVWIERPTLTGRPPSPSRPAAATATPPTQP